MANRLDRQDATGRSGYMAGRGNTDGFPTHGGGDSDATTGVPTNGIQGFAPGAIFRNWKGSSGTTLYVNIGTFLSATWLNVDGSINTFLANGLVQQMVDLTGALALTAALHANRTMLLDLVGGFTTTLPAATGTGNVYTFVVKTVSTAYVINTAGSDVYNGSILICALPITTGYASTAGTHITLNGTTKGGLTIGDSFQVQDIAAAVWAVSGQLTGSGTIVTPFS